MTDKRPAVAADIALRLGSALATFDWSGADRLCDELVKAVVQGGEPPPPPVVRVLSTLRRARRFACLTKIAEALIYSGQTSPTLWQQYAQALIEQGMLVAAERVLRNALSETPPHTREAFELQGSIGRVLKQWYVSAPSAPPERRRETLQRAIDAYLQPYRANPEVNYWHGINVVALAERGRRDGLEVATGQPPAEIARSLLASLEAAELSRAEGPSPWELSTMMEAQLALGRTDEVLRRAREYATHPATGAFELSSTLRQLVQVWDLSEQASPGAEVIALLTYASARMLREESAPVSLPADAIAAERQRAGRLEKVFGADKFQTLQWYRRGLECCSAVARVETPTGRGLGTGWLLAGRDWPATSPEPLLVTNAHVVSPTTRPYPGAIFPGDAVANFQVAGARSRLGEVVWSSPVDELDCTIVRLHAPPTVQPLELATQPVTYKAASRLYIIGHPGGHDLQFSLQDNLLVGCDARLLHYRTPTEGGSSGSPVFDDEWRVVGLHHAGDAYLARLDGQPGTYEANEGIAIAALLQAAAAAASV
jgi:V8-like Glu-specific endopeptidase